MGGRKGYTLKRIVWDLRKIKKERKELFEGIDEKDKKKVISASARILAKSDKAIESLAYSLEFVDELGKEYESLKKEGVKKRRKELAKKWVKFRKKEGKKFDRTINKEIVNSINRVLEGKNA